MAWNSTNRQRNNSNPRKHYRHSHTGDGQPSLVLRLRQRLWNSGQWPVFSGQYKPIVLADRPSLTAH